MASRRSNQDSKEALIGRLMRAMRRSSAAGVLHGQAIARRVGVNSSDLECLDLILLNGKLATLDAQRPFAEAASIQAGRFTRVGSAGEVMAEQGPDTRVVDLGGRTAIPGLNDSHIHTSRGGLNYNLELRWEGLPSLADALRRLREQAQRTPPPQWVRVIGQVHFVPVQAPGKREQWLSAVILTPSEREPLSKLVEVVPPPPNPFVE